MIADAMISVGRVGTLAAWHFLRNTPDIEPISWFDLQTVAAHWEVMQASPRRFMIIIHNPADLPVLNRLPEQARISWNTRCPFASARSSINWRVFQHVVTSDGRPHLAWPQLADPSDYHLGIPQVVNALGGREVKVMDIGDYAPGTMAGYQALARHHAMEFNEKAVPTSVQNGQFEAFLCNYRFRIGSLSYLLVPAEDLTWEGNDLFLGYVRAETAFPGRFDGERMLTAYVALPRPDSQWKRDFAWTTLQENVGGLAPQAEPKFAEYMAVYGNWAVAEDDPDLDELVNRAFGGRLAEFAALHPTFQSRWRLDRITS